jgi:guanylate kinase
MKLKGGETSVQKGRLVIISGASAGAGKDTLVSMFLKAHPDWQNPPSVTTRKPRRGETEGRNYYFLSEPEFKTKLRAGDFLETDFHAGHWYGTPKKPVEELLKAGKNVIVRKDVNGAVNIKKVIPDATVIFIDVEGHEVLERRLRERHTDTEKQIQYRLELAKKEQEFKERFDYVVVNVHNHPEDALKDIETALGL